MNDRPLHPTREDIYREVWEHPIQIVCLWYGISDVALAKGCRRSGIPLPGRGYWARKAAGKKTRPIPLPPLSESHYFIPEWRRLSEEEQLALIDAKAAKKRMRADITNVIADVSAAEPHPFVRSVTPILRKSPVGATGLRASPEGHLQIEVSDSSRERALALINLLLCTLEANGIRPRIGSSPERVVIDVSGVTLALALTESVRRTRHEPTRAEVSAGNRYWSKHTATVPQIPDFDYHPTGILTISVEAGYPRRKWNDTGKKTLEDRMPEIMGDLFVFADTVRREREHRAIEEVMRERLRAEYSAKVLRRNEEKARLKALRREATQWMRAQRIRAYADAVERKAVTGGTIGETTEWLEWARAKADCLDPNIEVLDLILDAPEPEPNWW